MRSYYCSTPYSLNLKLKELGKYNNLGKGNINILYKALNDSIPEITNQLCFLKNRTNALNKSLTKIPLINTNLNINKISKRYSPRSIKTSPNIYNYNNYSYISPNPTLKHLKSNFINSQDNIIKYQPIYSLNGYDKPYSKNNSQIKLNFKYDSCMDNSIKTFPKYNNRNYSAINIGRKNCNCYNGMKNNNFTFQKNYNFNKSKETNKDFYDEKFKKLNYQINEKDKIIYKMQGIINETFDKLNKKNQENSLLQSEIKELKSRKNYQITNDFNENDKNYNYIKEKPKIINGKRKKYHIKHNNHKKHEHYKNYNNYNDENMEQKWEEIRKLNKKMDNLLYKNENKFKKYENI